MAMMGRGSGLAEQYSVDQSRAEGENYSVRSSLICIESDWTGRA